MLKMHCINNCLIPVALAGRLFDPAYVCNAVFIRQPGYKSKVHLLPALLIL